MWKRNSHRWIPATPLGAFAGMAILLFTACAIRPSPLPVTSLSREAVREMRKTKGYWVEVQIPQRKLILAKGDHIIKAFPVAVGQPIYPSPVGVRAIDSVVWNPWWNPPKESDWVEDPTPIAPRMPDNPLGEIKMPLGHAYLIHGTKAVSSIGQWASHGCIRMLFEDIFGLVQLLLTEYSDVSAIDEMEKANKDPHTEFTTRLKLDVPVVLTYEPVRVHNGFVTISPDFYNRKGDFAKYVAGVIAPYLKEATPSVKKINNLLRMFKNQTINVPIHSLQSGFF